MVVPSSPVPQPTLALEMVLPWLPELVFLMKTWNSSSSILQVWWSSLFMQIVRVTNACVFLVTAYYMNCVVVYRNVMATFDVLLMTSGIDHLRNDIT